MAKVVKNSAVVAWSGGTTVLRAGQSIDDDHPLLAERPELFHDGENQSDLRSPTGPPQGVQGRPVVQTAAAEGPAGGRVRKVQGQ